MLDSLSSGGCPKCNLADHFVCQIRQIEFKETSSATRVIETLMEASIRAGSVSTTIYD